MTALGTTRALIAPLKRTHTPYAGKVICSGNSGFDRTFYGGGITTNLQAATNVAPNLVMSSIPGTSWNTRWTTATPGVDAKTSIANYDVLWITNASTFLDGGYDVTTSFAITTQWVDLAWNSGRGGLGAEVLFYATWAHRNLALAGTTTFVPDTLARMAGWPILQKYHNARLPTGQKPCRIIPGAWVWYKIWQDQVAGLTPTVDLFDSLFGPYTLDTDGVTVLDDGTFHQSDKGEWLNAALNLACVYGVDPLNLPLTMMGLNFVPRVPPSNAERLYLCGVIKSVLSSDPNNYFGVDTSGWS